MIKKKDKPKDQIKFAGLGKSQSFEEIKENLLPTKELSNLMIPKARSGSSFHNSPVKVVEEPIEIVQVQTSPIKFQDGGWEDGIVLKPTWAQLAQRIAGDASSSSSSDHVELPIIKPIYRILMKYSKLYIKEKELKLVEEMKP